MQRAPAPVRLGVDVIQRPGGICCYRIVARVCGNGCEAKMRPWTPNIAKSVG